MSRQIVHQIEQLHPEVRTAIREWLERGVGFYAELPIMPERVRLLSTTIERRRAKIEGTDSYVSIEELESRG